MTYSIIFHSIYRPGVLLFAMLFLLLTPKFNSEQATAANASADSLTAPSTDELNWREKFGTFRVGIVGGKHVVRRTKLAQPFRLALEKALGLPVEIFAATDYQSLALAHAESRVEYAVYSATAFAQAWMNCKCIEPLVAPRATDGTLAFRSVLVTRPDVASTLKELEGKVIAIPGKRSFSGYTYPKRHLLKRGVDIDGKKWNLSFQAGSASSRQAFSVGKADALFGWRPHRLGAEEIAYQGEDTRGTLYRLAKANDEFQVIWQSGPIPHGPHAIRKGLAPEARQLLTWFLDGLKIRTPDAYDAIEPTMGGGFQPTTLDVYRPLIDELQNKSTPLDSDNGSIDKAELSSELRMSN